MYHITPSSFNFVYIRSKKKNKKEFNRKFFKVFMLQSGKNCNTFSSGSVRKKYRDKRLPGEKSETVGGKFGQRGVNVYVSILKIHRQT